MPLLRALQSGISTTSAAATHALGLGIARAVPPTATTCLCLHGDLGVGKTTLVRGIAAAYGIDSISSPSFNYYFLYRGARPIVHLDAYRLSTPADYPSLMIDDLLTPDTFFIIEWPDRLGPYIPAGALHLHLSILSPGVHHFRLA